MGYGSSILFPSIGIVNSVPGSLVGMVDGFLWILVPMVIFQGFLDGTPLIFPGIINGIFRHASTWETVWRRRLCKKKAWGSLSNLYIGRYTAL